MLYLLGMEEQVWNRRMGNITLKFTYLLESEIQSSWRRKGDVQGLTPGRSSGPGGREDRLDGGLEVQPIPQVPGYAFNSPRPLIFSTHSPHPEVFWHLQSGM